MQVTAHLASEKVAVDHYLEKSLQKRRKSSFLPSAPFRKSSTTAAPSEPTEAPGKRGSISRMMQFAEWMGSSVTSGAEAVAKRTSVVFSSRESFGDGGRRSSYTPAGS